VAGGPPKSSQLRQRHGGHMKAREGNPLPTVASIPADVSEPSQAPWLWS